MRTRIRANVLVATLGTGAMVAGLAVAPTAADASTAGLPRITVTMNSDSIKLSGGTLLQAGRVVFAVKSGNGAEHSLQLMRFRNGYTLANFRADHEAGLDRDSSPAATRRIYKGVTFLGGTLTGHAFSETLYPGTYVLLDSDGPRPNFTRFHVSGTPSVRSWPGDGSVITARGMRFSAGGAIPGKGWTVFSNADSEPHFMSMVRVKTGTTRAMVKKAISNQTSGQPRWILGPGIDLGVVSPGTQILFRHNLPAGRYLALCFMPDPAHHDTPHALRGMYDFIRVR